jgi:hypothetical protein
MSKIFLLESLNSFYTNEQNMNNFVVILNNSNISLRVIDWFVTNYSKKHNTEIKYGSTNINIYMSYKSQLKSYSKKYFDPFCRRNRINFNQISTTLGQLNFFKWASSNGIIDYVIDNYNHIEDDMNQSMKLNIKKSSSRKKRKELSKSSYKTLTKRNNNIVLTFD